LTEIYRQGYSSHIPYCYDDAIDEARGNDLIGFNAWNVGEDVGDSFFHVREHSSILRDLIREISDAKLVT
jgi:hypothetical protein